MPNYIFTDANGQRQTINDHQLRTLAARGIITAQTPLETDAGQKGLAGQIPGLFPAVPSPFQTTPPPSNVPQQQGTATHQPQTTAMQMELGQKRRERGEQEGFWCGYST